jgi:hypothetical protein
MAAVYCAVPVWIHGKLFQVRGKKWSSCLTSNTVSFKLVGAEGMCERFHNVVRHPRLPNPLHFGTQSCTLSKLAGVVVENSSRACILQIYPIVTGARAIATSHNGANKHAVCNIVDSEEMVMLQQL